MVDGRVEKMEREAEEDEQHVQQISNKRKVLLQIGASGVLLPAQ